ncbi:unannotated protein [freshwater metagenome]|uniref:Unannotated protein n=1 Tax=freshwater metagenome TaxID=449393 RepID=A0A6J6UFV0_9ZZZZ
MRRVVNDNDLCGARPGFSERVRLRNRHDGVARAVDDRDAHRWRRATHRIEVWARGRRPAEEGLNRAGAEVQGLGGPKISHRGKCHDPGNEPGMPGRGDEREVAPGGVAHEGGRRLAEPDSCRQGLERSVDVGDHQVRLAGHPAVLDRAGEVSLVGESAGEGACMLPIDRRSPIAAVNEQDQTARGR